jgi:hypothetical protein
MEATFGSGKKAKDHVIVRRSCFRAQQRSGPGEFSERQIEEADAPKTKLSHCEQWRTSMIVTYLIVAGACALGLSYLGILHHCWLGESFKDPPLNRSGASTSKKSSRESISTPSQTQAPSDLIKQS